MKTKKYPIMGWPDDIPIHQAVGEAIGAGSVCWEHIDRAGVFNSTRAGAIVEELMTLLRAKQIGDD